MTNSNPIDVVIVDGVAVSKSSVRGYEKARVRQRVADANEVRNTSFSGQFGGLYVKTLDAFFDIDTSDTTSPDNGATVLIDADGNRFKLVGPGGSEVDVFLCIGDSNAVGQGSSASSPVTISGTVLQYAQDGTISNANDPTKTAFSAGQNANTGSQWPSFGNAYYRATGNKVGFVICGVNATTQTAAADLGSGNWDTTGTLVTAANAALTAALAAFDAAGYAPSLKGLIVDVGANDGLQIDNSVINQSQYQTALTNFLASCRSLLGNVALPIYIIQTGSNTTGGVSDSGYSQVRAAQVTVAAADPYTRIVCFNRIDFVARGMMQANSAHPTQAGYNEVGEIIAANIVADQSRIGPQQNGQDLYYTRGNLTVGWPVSSGVPFAVNKAGTTLPAGLSSATVAQLAAANGAGAVLELFGIGNPGSAFGRRANGTMAAPTRVSSGDLLVSFIGAGYDAVAGWSSNAAGAFAVVAAQDWVDATHHGAKLAFFVTPNATAAPVEKLDLNQDGTIRAYAYGAGIIHSDASGNLTSSSIIYSDIQSVTASRLLGNPTGGGAPPSEISLGATLAFSGSALQTAAHTGDITTSANSFVTTVAKIAGTTVSGTTGTGNVVFSASPTHTGQVTFANGSVGTPSFTLGDATTGAYRPALNSYAIATGGALAMYINASQQVGIGQAPDCPLTVNANTGSTTVAPVAGTLLHLVGADAVNVNLTFDAFGTSNSVFLARQAGNIRASPNAAAAGQNIFAIGAQGYDGVSAYGTVAGIDFIALNSTSTTDHSGYLRFRTVASGSAGAPAQVARLMQGLIVSSSLTTDPGAGGILADGAGVYFSGVGTTASAANAFLNNGSTPANQLLRSTSSLKYKTDVADLNPTQADKLLAMRPISYRSLADADDKDVIWYGFVAEEVAAVDPRLVHWGYGDDAYEWADEPAPDPKNPGAFLPPVFDEETGRCLQYRRLRADATLAPEGVQYERLTVLLLSIVKRQGDRIAALEARQSH